MGDYMPLGFGQRRKRDRGRTQNGSDTSINEQEESDTLGIDWDNTDTVNEHYGRTTARHRSRDIQEEDDQEDEEQEEGNGYLGKNKYDLTKFAQDKPADDRQKLTIYLEQELVEVLKQLKKNRQIVSISNCIQKALEEYLV